MTQRIADKARDWFPHTVALGGLCLTLLGVIAGSFARGVVDDTRYERLSEDIDELDASLQQSFRRRYLQHDKRFDGLSDELKTAAGKSQVDRDAIKGDMMAINGRLSAIEGRLNGR